MAASAGADRISVYGRCVLRAASVVGFAMLAGVAPANAEPPSVTISASATAGAAPLTVTFEARGNAASYRWQLGNGQMVEGPTASATYGPGLWTVTVTATAADGATAQASVTVRSVAVTLLPPAESRYGRRVAFRGRVVPALAAEPVALYVGGREVAAALADADGTFVLPLPRVRTPGPYEARTPVAASAPVTLMLHPVLRATFVGARAVGGRLALTARVWPAEAGTMSIRLYRDRRLVRVARAGAAARVGVATDRVAGYRAVVRVEPAEGWLGAVRVARADVLCARHAPGSRDAQGDGLVFQVLRWRRLSVPAVAELRGAQQPGVAAAVRSRAGSRPRCSRAPSQAAAPPTGSTRSPSRAGPCPGGRGSRRPSVRRRSLAPAPCSATPRPPPPRRLPSEGSAGRC